MKRIVAASAALAFTLGLTACSSPNIEAVRYEEKIIFTNKSEDPVKITAVKFPKQDCEGNEIANKMEEQRYGATKLSEPIKYGQSVAFYYRCKGTTTLLHAEIETDQGDMEFSWD